MSSINAKTRQAGVLYLVMGLLGWFSIIYIPSAFVVRGDPAATARNITNAEFIFRLGILSQLVSQIIFIVLVLLLYDLFEDVDRYYARIMVALVAVSVAVEIANCLNLIAPLNLLNGADALSAFSKAQLDALASSFLRLRSSGLSVVSIFWGLWLFPLGMLVIKSGYFPKVLGVVLIAACAGYVAGSVTYILFPAQVHAVSAIALSVAGIGELSTVGWFIIKGANAPPLAAQPA